MKLALIGDNVFNSLSPQIMQFLGERLGIPLSYVPLELHGFSPIYRILRTAKKYDGLNITMPFKTPVANALANSATAQKLSGSLDDSAQKCGSVNVIKNDGGALRGYSTDGAGVLDALALSGIDVSGKNILILGAGGAARSAAFALKDAGARIEIRNRTELRAGHLAQECGAPAATPPYYAIFSFLPLYDETFGITKDEIAAANFVFDANYKRPTLLLSLARESVAIAIDGLPMLFFQAARGFEIFTGVKVPDPCELYKQFSAMSPR